MMDNMILLTIGLFAFSLIAVVGEIAAKKFGWE